MFNKVAVKRDELFQKNLDDSYVLNVVVRVEKSSTSDFNQVFQAATNAFVKMFIENENVLPPTWFKGSMKKVVKRARGARWDDVKNLKGACYGEFQGAEVVIFPPVKRENTPEVINKLQMSGLQLNTNSFPLKEGVLNVAPNFSVDMTSGKLLAQMLHGVQVFLHTAEPHVTNQWVNSGYSVNVCSRYDELFDEADSLNVRDWGLTEIPAGTSTVVVVYGS